MHWVNTNDFVGYFGSEVDNLQNRGDYSTEKFLALQKKLMQQDLTSPKSLFFLKQTHSADVYVLREKNDIQKPLDIFQHEGDAIITAEKNIGIGVATADCLPLILYDSHHPAIGVIHAGWRGLHLKIITATILKMHALFKTVPETLKVYLGPSASVCCYEVRSDFLLNFPDNSFEKGIIEKRDEKLFFNARRAALDELLENEISESLIDVTHNSCTICTPGFCSVRKPKGDAGRQPSVVFLP